MGRTKIQITLQDLEPLFVYPIKEAAARLHMSKTTLKQRCRELNLMSWPFKRKYGKPNGLGDDVNTSSPPSGPPSPLAGSEVKVCRVGAHLCKSLEQMPVPSDNAHPSDAQVSLPPELVAPPPAGHPFAPLPTCLTAPPGVFAHGLASASSGGPILLMENGTPFLGMATHNMLSVLPVGANPSPPSSFAPGTSQRVFHSPAAAQLQLQQRMQLQQQQIQLQQQQLQFQQQMQFQLQLPPPPRSPPPAPPQPQIALPPPQSAPKLEPSTAFPLNSRPSSNSSSSSAKSHRTRRASSPAPPSGPPQFCMTHFVVQTTPSATPPLPPPLPTPSCCTCPRCHLPTTSTGPPHTHSPAPSCTAAASAPAVVCSGLAEGAGGDGGGGGNGGGSGDGRGGGGGGGGVLQFGAGLTSMQSATVLPLASSSALTLGYAPGQPFTFVTTAGPTGTPILGPATAGMGALLQGPLMAVIGPNGTVQGFITAPFAAAAASVPQPPSLAALAPCVQLPTSGQQPIGAPLLAVPGQPTPLQPPPARAPNGAVGTGTNAAGAPSPTHVDSPATPPSPNGSPASVSSEQTVVDNHAETALGTSPRNGGGQRVNDDGYKDGARMRRSQSDRSQSLPPGVSSASSGGLAPLAPFFSASASASASSTSSSSYDTLLAESAQPPPAGLSYTYGTSDAFGQLPGPASSPTNTLPPLSLEVPPPRAVTFPLSAPAVTAVGAPSASSSTATATSTPVPVQLPRPGAPSISTSSTCAPSPSGRASADLVLSSLLVSPTECMPPRGPPVSLDPNALPLPSADAGGSGMGAGAPEASAAGLAVSSTGGLLTSMGIFGSFGVGGSNDLVGLGAGGPSGFFAIEDGVGGFSGTGLGGAGAVASDEMRSWGSSIGLGGGAGGGSGGGGGAGGSLMVDGLPSVASFGAAGAGGSAGAPGLLPSASTSFMRDHAPSSLAMAAGLAAPAPSASSTTGSGGGESQSPPPPPLESPPPLVPPRSGSAPSPSAGPAALASAATSSSPPPPALQEQQTASTTTATCPTPSPTAPLSRTASSPLATASARRASLPPGSVVPEGARTADALPSASSASAADARALPFLPVPLAESASVPAPPPHTLPPPSAVAVAASPAAPIAAPAFTRIPRAQPPAASAAASTLASTGPVPLPALSLTAHPSENSFTTSSSASSLGGVSALLDTKRQRMGSVASAAAMGMVASPGTDGDIPGTAAAGTNGPGGPPVMGASVGFGLFSTGIPGASGASDAGVTAMEIATGNDGLPPLSTSVGGGSTVSTSASASSLVAAAGAAAGISPAAHPASVDAAADPICTLSDHMHALSTNGLLPPGVTPSGCNAGGGTDGGGATAILGTSMPGDDSRLLSYSHHRHVRPAQRGRSNPGTSIYEADATAPVGSQASGVATEHIVIERPVPGATPGPVEPPPPPPPGVPPPTAVRVRPSASNSPSAAPLPGPELFAAARAAQQQQQQGIPTSPHLKR